MTETTTSHEPRSSAATPPDYETVEVPVLVIGAGAAGARTAIELAENDVETLVIGKRGHGDAHTTWAAGGINGALGSLDPEDDWTIHAADTLDEGHYINDPVAVETVTEAMPARLRELDAWGMDFDRAENGRINQRYFGAQSFRRTAFVGDRTGEAILETLVEKAQSLSIPYRENVLVTELLSDGEAVHGAVAVDLDTGEFVLFETDYVVLAAGGASALYGRHSSRDDENNADGVALAYEAGAQLMDMEFVQFHPTGMVGDRYGETWDGRLVTEAVRGEGGRLFNAEGERFMERYSPDQMELDARDVVARAISQEIREGRGTENDGVYLDISHRDPEYIESRLPKMHARFQSLDVDITQAPMEVAPTAHYTMGGVDIDWENGSTGVDGLYAVGETVAGVHGANRLGGNSLAETVAMGQVVGDHLADQAPARRPLPDGQRTRAHRSMGRLAERAAADGGEDPRALIEEIREVMDEHAGILRTAEELEAGLDQLSDVRERASELGLDADRTSRRFEFGIDLSFMLTGAESILRGALRRNESRGAHSRTDYPEVDPELQENILAHRADGEMTLGTRAVEEPSAAVREAVDVGYELDYHHLE